MIRLRVFIFSLLLGIGRLAAAEPVDLLLVAATDEALQPVLAKVTGAKAITRGAWTTWTGRLAGKNVALTRAEGDPLNAVAATTLAIRLHAPRLIVVFGTGRAHDPALSAGDTVVSEKFAAFDGFVSPITELEGGSRPRNWKRLMHPLMTPGEKESSVESFPADQAAAKVALAVKPARGRVVSGVLGSAHQINREADRIAWLRAKWQTSTEDGVSAHVAGCAALFSVPVVGVCIVDGTANEAADFALRLVEGLR